MLGRVETVEIDASVAVAPEGRQSQLPVQRQAQPLARLLARVRGVAGDEDRLRSERQPGVPGRLRDHDDRTRGGDHAREAHALSLIHI